MSRKRNSGIALVIVLGFIAIITMLAVSFAAYMRTERRTAVAYIETVQARELAYAGMSRALAEIDLTVGFNIATPYPQFNDLMSAGTSGGSLVGDILSGFAEESIPTSVLPTNDLTQQLWTDVLDPNNSNPSNVIGRYAYLVVNCSGLLDISKVGGKGSKDKNVDAGDLDLHTSILPELNGESIDEMRRRAGEIRKNCIDFFTLSDMERMTQMGSSIDIRRNRWSGFPEHTFFYSLATNAWYDRHFSVNGGERLKHRTFIGRDYNEIFSNQVDIVSGFGFFASAEPTMMFSCLLDYVDSNNVPLNLDGPSVETVPTINEVYVTNSIVQTLALPATYRNDYRIEVELWYPFVTANVEGYEVEVSIEPEGGAYIFNNKTEVLDAGSGWSQNLFRELSFSFSSEPLIGGGSSANAVSFDIVVREKSSAEVVDRTVLRFDGIASDIGNTPVTIGAEAIDPRLNWTNEYSVNTYWVIGGSYQKSLGNVNSVVTNTPSYYGGYLTNGPLFYARNDNRFDSVVELTHLPYGYGVWNQLAFSSSNEQELVYLDCFTVSSNRNGALKGMINPNTDNPHVLRTIFFNYDLDVFPTAYTNGTAITDDGASNLAAIVLSATTNQPLLNRSEMVTAIRKLGTNVFDYVDPVVPQTEFYQVAALESLLGATIEVTDTKQQIYTVIVASQSGKVNANGVFIPLTTQRAVAVVWRDPIRNTSTGVNPCFIRFFHWIEEG